MQIQIPQLDPTQQQMRDQQNQEIRNYTLVGDGGWLTWTKIAVALLLGGWNLQFFITTVAGIMGLLTAAVAVHIEITAVYCFHNYPRSVERHKKALLVFSIILMTFSTIHAVFAMITYTGYAQGVPFVEFYSNVIALPLVVVLLTVSTMTLTMTHPKAKIIAELAAAKLESFRNRAQTLIQEHKLMDAQELMTLKAGLFKAETEIKNQLIPLVQERIKGEENLANQVDGIQNPEIRHQIRLELEALSKHTHQQLPPGP